MKRALSVVLSLCLLLSSVCAVDLGLVTQTRAAEQPVIRILRDGAYLPTVYTSLVDANNAAKAGDTLQLEEATYEISMITATHSYGVSFSKQITLRGPDGGYATLIPTDDWSASSGSTRLINFGGTAITAENLIIDCARITDSVAKMHGVYTACMNLVLNNIIIRNCKSSCLCFGTAPEGHVTTANGLYCHTTASKMGDTSFHQVDISGGKLIFNSGVIHGTCATSGSGVMQNNAVNTLGPISYGVSKGYMSDTYAAQSYPNLGLIYKSQVKSFIKNNADAFLNLANRYTTMRPYELTGADALGNENLTTVAGLLTISSECKNTAATTSLNASIARADAIKANAENALATLSYSIDGAPATAIADFDEANAVYRITLPAGTSPTAVLSLSGTAKSEYADVINSRPVTLTDGTGTATIDGWGYAASPRTKTYSVQFTVPKFSVSFLAGAHGTFSGTASQQVFYNTAWNPLWVPTPVPDENYRFLGWDATFPESVTCSQDFTALYELLPRELTLVEELQAVRLVREGDTAALMTEYLIQIGALPKDSSPVLHTASGEICSSDSRLATGMILRTADKDYTVIMNGDVNGDAEIDRTDLSEMTAAALAAQTLTGAYRDAADINRDGVIDVFDQSAAEQYLSGASGSAIVQ